MIYALTFLEGILTFLSPCILPMVPVYLSYFGGMEAKNGKKTAVSSLGFILGFTVVFMAMGALSGTIGRFLVRYAFWFNLVCGLILVVFGLGQLGVIPLTVFRGKALGNLKQEKYGFFPSLLFGIVFSVSWTPCISTFLGTALVMASQRGSTLEGILLLFLYAMGLGIPFFLSALLLHTLQQSFQWVKKHYRAFQIVCGVLLIVLGVLMMTGLFARWLAVLA
ncbi:MAG: cytochrome c biogenesis protein CcdA [Clostridia bacterium]|nr:cytochrome c biogenesis protein CcdA [Clostridia bacterium]